MSIHGHRLVVLALGVGCAYGAEPTADTTHLTATDTRVAVRKDFTPAWITALTARGEATVARSTDPGFAFLGMPIGGIGAGEVYLGGDGQLWFFDIFNNRVADTFQVEGGEAYVRPMRARDPGDNRQEVLAQGFALRVGGKVRALDATGFADVRFRGEYPIGSVDYADPACPVRVHLEAFSPFVPGSVEDSSWPATVLTWTVENSGDQVQSCELGGWLENAVGRSTRQRTALDLTGAVAPLAGGSVLAWSAAQAPGARAPILIGDFESGTYDGWTVEGTAFGTAPQKAGAYHHEEGFVRCTGRYYIDTLATGGATGSGRLTSKPFVIDRAFITFQIGGGKHADLEGVQLLIDGKPVRSSTGHDINQMYRDSWDVREFAGRTAQVRIIDEESKGTRRHVLVDELWQSDTPFPVALAADMGGMALAFLGAPAEGVAVMPGAAPAEEIFASAATATAASSSGSKRQVGGLRRTLSVPAHGSASLSTVIAWHLPNPLPLGISTPTRRQYATRFASVQHVVGALAADLPRLGGATRAWHDTWYDSTLPRWFLDRTFTNVSTLACSTSFLLEGRFYANEGRYSCPGTCTHVWGYQQALGFLFPELERSLRLGVDFNPMVAMRPDGGVAFRGECAWTAVDGQAEILLRALLAHRMSPDDAFAKTVFPGMRKAADWLIRERDPRREGILSGQQDNTLDAAWFARNAWISLLYQAGLRATAEIADRVGEGTYASDLRRIADAGRKAVEETLFNGEYFTDIPDPNVPQSAGPYGGCHIDQLMGQGWAWHAGLGTIIDPQKAATALEALWKANVTSDVAPNRAIPDFAKGRRYAMDGEGGTLMGTFPRGFNIKAKQCEGDYFNEVWSGSEHFLAATMMWQGEALRALAIERLIHDRYSLPKRNPWDECECGSHYARAMASYGVFTAACGFTYDGPTGNLGFAPRLSPQNFKAAFTAAEGWGSFAQRQDGKAFTASVTLRHGRLHLTTLWLTPPIPGASSQVSASVDGKPVAVTAIQEGGRLGVRIAGGLDLGVGQQLVVRARAIFTGLLAGSWADRVGPPLVRPDHHHVEFLHLPL